tara:strand:+ start:136 stop:768 length:633 start_codon:yes stop_codon:yes gene_type:complete
MIDRNMQRTKLILAAVVVLLAGLIGCGGGPSFTPEDATALILEQYPDSDLHIQNVSIDENDRGIASALFNDDIWTFYFRLQENGVDSWVLDAVETDGRHYYLKDLERISVTFGLMAEVASALEIYKAANGSYPEGENAAALSVMAPDFNDAGGASFTDAWDGMLSYESDGENYTMISNGADKIAGTGDDIILHDGQFISRESSGSQGTTP